jgi:putative ABC transport system ATP-binding protein
MSMVQDDNGSIMEEPAVHVDKVNKSYGDTAVLHEVGFDVPRSRLTAIMGPSGSGKSTLLRCIAGLESIDSGSILVAGREVQTMKPKEQVDFRRNTIGFVFQSSNLIPVLTAHDNITLTADLAHATIDQDWYEHVIDTMELQDLLLRLPNELSGGQQQRVAIARALLQKPDVILADEPTGALDSVASMHIIALLKDACVDQLGSTVIMVTHSDLMSKYADTILHLTDGEVIDHAYHQ